MWRQPIGSIYKIGHGKPNHRDDRTATTAARRQHRGSNAQKVLCRRHGGPPVSDLDDADRPATFREVLANGEFRTLFSAAALSWFGDYVAKAAVTALVFYKTGSVAESAATFAISYLPWLGLGPFLSALAERLPYRRTMVVTDLLRMVLIALVVVPNMPIWGMIALLFAAAVCA